MDKNQNHWIALYLSGQYPGRYIMSDRLSFFDELKLEDQNRYNDTVLGQFQSKNDVEFFLWVIEFIPKKSLRREI